MKDAITKVVTVKICDHKSAYICLEIAKDSFGLMSSKPLKIGSVCKFSDIKFASSKSNGKFALTVSKDLLI
jgi:hypothetical protein